MKKLKRIGPKMLISLLASFIAVLGTFFILTLVQTTSLAEEMATDLTQNTVENYANRISIQFQRADNMALGLKIAAEQFESIPAENRRSYMDSMLEEAMATKTDGVVNVWACFEPNQLDGLDNQYRNSDLGDAAGRYSSMFFDNGKGIEHGFIEDYDVPGDGDFYLIPLQTGKPYVTPPYEDQIGDQTVGMVSIAHPIANRAGQIVGVIGFDYSIQHLSELNSEIELYESGYGKLLTDQGLTVAHFDQSYLGTPDSDLTNAEFGDEILATLQSGGTWVGQSFSRVVNANSYKAFTNISLGSSGTNWYYAVIAPASEVLSTSNQMIVMITIIGIVGLALVVVIVILLSRSIANPIKAICGIAGRIADGDLTTSVPNQFLKKEDELGELSNDIQRMRDGLATTVSGINSAADALDIQVTTVNSAINVLHDRISDTSAATEELSAGMEETGASAFEMSTTASDIEHAVGSVAEKSEEGAGKAAEIQNRATELSNNIGASIEKSNHIFQEIKTALEKALKDSEAVHEINVLADAILAITSQTTLLALNASIEAARAGEAGKGFAVVANEISGLAANSENTVNQIQAITKIVMNAVGDLADSASNLLSFVSGQVQDDYQDMVKAAESYTGDAVFISDMTSDLNATSEELLASTQILMRTINEVSSAAQEGAKTTSVVAGQTTDIASNASTVAENMNHTKDIATELSELIGKFKL